MKDTKPRIAEKLVDLEENHRVRILYACEAGSRGWGFESEDSDYDVRFLYVHEPKWYLQVLPSPRDVIETPIVDNIDIGGWELRKALHLLWKGNAVVSEWLSSPTVYCSDPAFTEDLKYVVSQVYRPERSFYHYLHMAENNFREYLRGESVRTRKYLYVLRPVLAAAWVEQGMGIPPMKFQDLVEGIVYDLEVVGEISRVLKIKKSTVEPEYGPAIPLLNQFLEGEISRLKSCRVMDLKKSDFSLLDKLMEKAVLRLY